MGGHWLARLFRYDDDWFYFVCGHPVAVGGGGRRRTTTRGRISPRSRAGCVDSYTQLPFTPTDGVEQWDLFDGWMVKNTQSKKKLVDCGF